MTTIEFDRLKKICGDLMRANGLKITTVKGREAIHLFWYGVMAQAKENPVFIGICLLSGRHEELVDMTGEIGIRMFSGSYAEFVDLTGEIDNSEGI